VFAGKHREATQIGTWGRAAVNNMAAGFFKRGGDPAQADDAAIDKLHSVNRQVITFNHREGKIGQLVLLGV